MTRPEGSAPAHAGGSSSHGMDEAPVFVGDRKRELDELLLKYPTKMAALLPALWIVQAVHGWVSERSMAEVAEVLGLTPAYVKGVVTFYTMYHQHPVGRHFIQVCTTSPFVPTGTSKSYVSYPRYGKSFRTS